MKEIILLMLTVVMSTSCKPRIDNSPETLEKVFAMPDFDIEIRSSGCFGGSEDHFVVKLEDDGYLLKSKRTGKVV